MEFAVSKQAQLQNDIQFLTDDQGHKTGVLVDFSQHGELWEGIYDNLVAELRVDEPRESFEVERMLREQVKLSE